MDQSGQLLQPLILVQGKLKQEDHKFKVNLSCMWRPCTKKGRDGDVAQWWRNSLHKALGSIPNSEK
jgi:hypothetical protein